MNRSWLADSHGLSTYLDTFFDTRCVGCFLHGRMSGLIEADMRRSRLARDRQTDIVLRLIIQAFDNASAVESDNRNRATYGLGGEVARKALTGEVDILGRYLT